MARQRKTHDPFRWFDSSPEVIRLVVMMYVGTVSPNFPRAVISPLVRQNAHKDDVGGQVFF